jgi:hypothetical protein
MAINKKLIHFKKKENFENEVANNNILSNSIVFIQDSREISTHGTVYKTVCWSILEENLTPEPEDPVVPPTPDPEPDPDPVPDPEVSNIGDISASSGININSESLLPGTYELRYIDENDNIVENFDPITTFTI